MNDKSSEQPAIPMAMLRKLVLTLSPDELAKLPPEKLPDNIPVDLVDMAPIYSRTAVENLIMAANTFHLGQRMEIQERYGDEVLTAIDKSKAIGNTANVRIFNNKLKELEFLNEQWKQAADADTLKCLTTNIKALNPLLLDVRVEKSQVDAALSLLLRQSFRYETYSDVFRNAIKGLKEYLEQIDILLAHYYLLRLIVAQVEMEATVALINQLDSRVVELSAEIDRLREQLENSQKLWKRTLKRATANKDAEMLQASIMQLVSERQSHEVAISETDLTLWLDSIVDASLHPVVRERVQARLTDTRMSLYTMLNRYCRGQEESAMQIARNPFLQVDPAQAIRFVLMSEQFILDYFSRKRNQNTDWISDMAQVKIEDLDEIERMILTELKRSSRFMKK